MISKSVCKMEQYKLRMKPLKCAFVVSSLKFLGFNVHRKRIDLDLAKAKAIQDIEPPTTFT